MKWRAIDRLIARTKYAFFHSGSVRSDSLDDSAFIAFSISITTRLASLVTTGCPMPKHWDAYIESDIVEAALA